MSALADLMTGAGGQNYGYIRVTVTVPTGNRQELLRELRRRGIPFQVFIQAAINDASETVLGGAQDECEGCDCPTLAEILRSLYQ